MTGHPNSICFLEQMTLDIVKYLEKKTGVCQLKNDVKAPAERAAVLMWEQKHSLLLPDDLKSFFKTNNGFNLTWSVKMENSTLPVGHMHINSVGSLTRLENAVKEGSHVQPSLWDMDFDEDPLSSGRKVPSFSDSKIFELDPCDGYGTVCLVYNESKQDGNDSDSASDGDGSEFRLTSASDMQSEIWFLDRSLNWHFLCDSFMAYYRLMLMHLGLPQWQFSFTDIGLPPQSEQWFNLYAPIRLEVDLEGGADHSAHMDHSVKVTASPLDLNKVFKGKSDRKKVPGQSSQSVPLAQAKRKPPVSSARSAMSSLNKTGTSNNALPVKSNR